MVNNFGTAVEDRKNSEGKGTEVLKTLDEVNKEQDKKVNDATKKSYNQQVFLQKILL